jgi:hypothetical protein
MFGRNLGQAAGRLVFVLALLLFCAGVAAAAPVGEVAFE